MVAFVLTDAQITYGGLDITGLSNQIGINYAAEAKDSSVFGVATRKRLSGLITADTTHQGLWDSSADSAFFDKIGGTPEVLTILPDAGAVGSRAFFLNALNAEYTLGADIGEIFGFTLNTQSDGTLVRGLTIAENTFAVDTDGASIVLPAVAAGETLYAAMHVLAASGSSPTLDVDIVSDDNDNFTSGSTSRLSFTQVIDTLGAELISIAGPITDTFYRPEITITGGTPSYQILIVVGVSGN